MKNMELFYPITQLEIKREYLSGKMGVGQTANQLVDHNMNQSINIELNTYLGIGNVKEYKTKKGNIIKSSNICSDFTVFHFACIYLLHTFEASPFLRLF